MKTKKTKIFVFLAVLLFLVTPIFSGCDTSIKLNKPTFINYQVNDSTGEQLLITENNIYAKDSGGWIFGISTVYENEDTSNFFTYKSDKPYFYVTDIFVNAQTYYFYSQAIGKGKYLTSDISEVKSVTITYKLDAPVLELNGTTLSWTPVENASTYIIYANDVVVTETSQVSYDIQNYISNQNGNVPYTFTIACKQNNNYLKSAKSNAKTYTDHLVLSVPTNLKVTGGSNKSLTWNAVTNCNKYKVVINNSIEKEVYGTSLNITDVYNQYGVGTYTFKVMAVGEGYFADSEYSDILINDYTLQLSTPTDLQSAVESTYIKLMWDEVENASEYALYLNGKRFYVNQSTGINSPIVTNCVIINNEDLLSYDLKHLYFTVQALASSGSYYTNSSVSNESFINTQLSVLSTPNISVDSANGYIVINNVDGAVYYQIDYTFKGEAQTPIFINAGIANVIYFDYKTYFSQVGNYSLKVKAVAEYESLNSAYSNEVSFEIEPPVVYLSAPIVNEIYVSGDNLYIDFDNTDENAQKFSLYANDKLITTTISQDNNYVALDTLFDIVGSCSSLQVCLLANSTDEYHLASNKSNKVSMITTLAKPASINLNGSILSWSAVKNAQTYCLVLDNDVIDLDSTSTSVNVTNHIDTNKTRQIKLFAHTDYFTDSAVVGNYIYNNVSTARTGYTDKYFFYGETYDYYITNQEELNALVKYAVDNFLDKIEFYIDYNNTITNSEKMDLAAESLTTTYDFSWARTGGSSYSGVCTIKFYFDDMVQCTDATKKYSQYSSTYQYKSNLGRSSTYNNFASDKWYVTQDVYTTDGLVSALENKAIPNFVGNDTKPQEIYNKAKQILTKICDDSMTDYQKALAIHDYIILNTSYDYYGLSAGYSTLTVYYHYLEGFFDYGLTVCDGYAKTYSLLCNMEGIHTITIGGATDKDDTENTGHAWNKSYLDADGDGDKEWLSVDCTWDDGAKSMGGTSFEVLSHEYFMIPDDYIGERYEDIEYPQSTTYGATYYDIFTIGGNTLKIDTISQYNAIAQYLLSSSYKCFEILLSKTVSAQVYGVSKYTYTYDFESGYNQVFIYKN